MTSRLGVGLLLLVIPACLQFSLFESDTPVTNKIQSTGVMKQTILNHVPAGTGLKKARRFLEKEGFEVELKRNGTFVANGIQHQGVDFLLCTRTDIAGADVVEVNWRLAVALRDDKVGAVWVTTDLFELPTLAAPTSTAN